MTIREAISLALSSLRTNKMRSFLTLLGIIVGIASVIAIMTLGHSLKTQASDSIVSSGANDLMVSVKERPKEGESPAATNPYGMGGMFGSSGVEPDEDSKFDVDDINRVKELMGDNIAGVPMGLSMTSSVNFIKGEVEEYSQVSFVNTDTLELNPLDIVAGRSITQADIDTKRPVVVIDTNQLGTFYEGDVTAAVGKEIEIERPGGGTMTAVVVGVYQSAMASGPFAFTGYSTSYMPYTLEGEVTGYNDGAWSYINVRPAEGKDLGQVKAQLQGVLAQMYRSNEKFEAEIQDFSAMTESFNDVLNGISAAISAIAGISLLVGGIGVMNIMLVTVTERTREIGVRKALGATRGAIRLQFVVEAMIVCLVGGVIGVLVGGVLGSLGSSLLGTFVFPPVGTVLLALGFSLAIGLFFGYYPANKAAKMDPIDALRYE